MRTRARACVRVCMSVDSYRYVWRCEAYKSTFSCGYRTNRSPTRFFIILHMYIYMYLESIIYCRFFLLYHLYISSFCVFLFSSSCSLFFLLFQICRSLFHSFSLSFILFSFLNSHLYIYIYVCANIRYIHLYVCISSRLCKY